MSHWPTKPCFRCSRVPDYTPKACDACRDFAAYLAKYKAQLAWSRGSAFERRMMEREAEHGRGER